jgi:hypothetical protein
MDATAAVGPWLHCPPGTGYNGEPTHQELETLYEATKKNQRNGSTAID